jgi:hypothetical protein
MRAGTVPCDSRRCLILLIRAARDDPQRIVRHGTHGGRRPRDFGWPSFRCKRSAGDAFRGLLLARNREAHFGPKENVLVR